MSRNNIFRDPKDGVIKVKEYRTLSMYRLEGSIQHAIEYLESEEQEYAAEGIDVILDVDYDEDSERVLKLRWNRLATTEEIEEYNKINAARDKANKEYKLNEFNRLKQELGL